MANGRHFLVADADNPHFAAASGGIQKPAFVALAKGTRLYRFGHSVDDQGRDIPRYRNYGSPWWIGAQDFHRVVGAPRPRGRELFVWDGEERPEATGFDSYGFNAMVRTTLALPRRFGQADRIIEAVLLASLGAFAGQGRPILEDANGAPCDIITGGVFAFEASPTVRQLYIPGLRSDPGGSASHAVGIVKDRPAHEFFIL